MPLFLHWSKLKKDAFSPYQGSPGAAGYDLKAIKDGEIPVQSRGVVDTGISFQIPEGYYGRIAPRSGLSVKKSIDVGAGVVDSDYTGEIKVVLINGGTEPFVYKRGDRIAQIIITSIQTCPLLEVDSLEQTKRGAGGFGSTGR